MKNRILTIVAAMLMIAFFSCNKTSSPTPAPPIQDSTPHSFSVYNPLIHSKAVENFTYNNQSALVSIRAYNYDSSSGIPFVDSFFISFTLSGSVNPPSAYDETIHLQGDPPAGNEEHHLLFYDNQERVTNDSVSMATSGSFSVQHYDYDNNGNTTIQWLFGDPQTPGSYVLNQIDTMYIANETILTDINYSSPGGPLNYLFTRSYSTHINPLYNATLANSLGCLMVSNNFFDFRSKYLPAEFTDQEGLNAAFTINYLWKTDGTGAVVSGVGTSSTDGKVQQIYTFIY